jgi:iduronate 2-sulfatase
MACRGLILLSLIWSFGTPFELTADEPPAHPNVLLIMSDDLNTALSGFGHPQCKTPNLDRLARRGVSFHRMYCQFPVCGASRSSMMNGLYPYSTGDLKNTTIFRKFRPDAVTLPQLFMNNGYYVARVGKIYHMGIPQEVIDGTAIADDPQSWGETYNIQCGEQNLPGKKIQHSPGWKGSQTFQRVEATDGDLAMADGLAATKTIELMKKHRGEPFFIACGFVRPHVPLVAPESYFRMYPEPEMILPKVPVDDLEDVGQATRAYKTNESLQITTEQMPGILSAYYGCVSHMDFQVGRLLDALVELGLKETTLVVFTSDHGYHLGEHHKWQKQHLFEETTRVPFILSAPWLSEVHGKSTQHMCELVDLYPTVSSLCHLSPPEYIQGESMVSILKDVETKSWTKDSVFSVSTREGASLRNGRYRYTEWARGAKGVELYDLKNDPGEFTNVAELAEYRSVREGLANQMKEKRKSASSALGQK